jgi:hypothetical protein
MKNRCQITGCTCFLISKRVHFGMFFQGKLFEILFDPDATQKLNSTIIQKYETGKTYLKIPVEN